jgi:hypothetical protein
MLFVLIVAVSGLVVRDVFDALNRPRRRSRSGYVW